ncbi:MAG: hypothetical protein LBJ47_10150 [Tannerella sp.]|nr:hypothetical protein [Tannerella sp.]
MARLRRLPAPRRRRTHSSVVGERSEAIQAQAAMTVVQYSPAPGLLRRSSSQ